MNWAYGVTTVRGRREATLPATLDSLKRAGFPTPRLFVDGDTDNSRWTGLNLPFTLRYPAVGVFGNWVLSIWELYLRNPLADRFALFQDDLLACKNLRRYLECSPYPKRGYMNLYLWPQNAEIVPLDPGGKPIEGWYESNQLGLGAVGLVFNRGALQRLLESPNIVERPTEVLNPQSKVDGAILWAMHLIQWKEWVHYPSLIQHTGVVSTMGNPRHPDCPDWRGEEWDPLYLVKTGDRVVVAGEN